MNSLSHIVNQINWHLVASCLANKLNVEKGISNWIMFEKIEMVSRLQLMLDLNLLEFETKYWRIIKLPTLSSDEICFHVIFKPIDMILTFYNRSLIAIEIFEDLEWKCLQNLAQQYATAEDYLKLDIIKKRLNEIIANKNENQDFFTIKFPHM